MATKNKVQTREFHPGDDVWAWMAENTKGWDLTKMKDQLKNRKGS